MTALATLQNKIAVEQTATVPPVERAELDLRLTFVREEMQRQGISLAAFTTPESIYYVSGYHTRAITSNQCLLVSDQDAVLIIRRIDEGNYLSLKHRSPITQLMTFSDDQAYTSMDFIGSVARDMLGSNGVVGAEPDGLFMPHRQFEKLQAALDGIRIVDIGRLVDQMRLIKSAWEIDCHRAAARITAATMRRAVDAVQPGALDSDIAAEVASSTIRFGSEWVATWPVILTGRQTGRSHSSWQRDAVQPGQPTALEFACVMRRYHSPLFRTVIVSPTPEQVRLSEAVSVAHQAGIQALKPGARAEDPYLAEQEALAGFGVVDLLSGRVGYTIGIGFAPNWVQRNGIDLVNGNRRELKPGMIFHMVTMVMRADEFGIAHSSTVVLTESDREILTVDGLSGPILR